MKPDKLKTSYPQYIVDDVKKYRKAQNIVPLTDAQINSMPRRNVFTAAISAVCSASVAERILTLLEDVFGLNLTQGNTEFAISQISTGNVENVIFKTEFDAKEFISTQDNPTDWQVVCRKVLRTAWEVSPHK